MNTENRSSLARSRDARWDLLLDGLSCWLLSIGVILAFDQLFRFHASPAAIVLHPLLIIGILLLFYRRTWLIPILLLAGLCLTAAILSVSGALTPALEYLGSLFRWWMDLFPRRSPLNTAGNILLVQWLIHIGITCTLYLCVRLTHSAVFIASGRLSAVFDHRAQRLSQQHPRHGVDDGRPSPPAGPQLSAAPALPLLAHCADRAAPHAPGGSGRLRRAERSGGPAAPIGHLRLEMAAHGQHGRGFCVDAQPAGG